MLGWWPDASWQQGPAGLWSFEFVMGRSSLPVLQQQACTCRCEAVRARLSCVYNHRLRSQGCHATPWFCRRAYNHGRHVGSMQQTVISVACVACRGSSGSSRSLSCPLMTASQHSAGVPGHVQGNGRSGKAHTAKACVFATCVQPDCHWAAVANLQLGVGEVYDASLLRDVSQQRLVHVLKQVRHSFVCRRCQHGSKAACKVPNLE
jgi:hypothetical protein